MLFIPPPDLLWKSEYHSANVWLIIRVIFSGREWRHPPPHHDLIWDQIWWVSYFRFWFMFLFSWCKQELNCNWFHGKRRRDLMMMKMIIMMTRGYIFPDLNLTMMRVVRHGGEEGEEMFWVCQSYCCWLWLWCFIYFILWSSRLMYNMRSYLISICWCGWRWWDFIFFYSPSGDIIWWWCDVIIGV